MVCAEQCFQDPAHGEEPGGTPCNIYDEGCEIEGGNRRQEVCILVHEVGYVCPGNSRQDHGTQGDEPGDEEHRKGVAERSLVNSADTVALGHPSPTQATAITASAFSIR